MLSSIVKMPTKMLISPGMIMMEKKKKKKPGSTAHHHHSCYINIKDEKEKPAAAAFQSLSVSSSSCRFRSEAGTMQDSAMADHKHNKGLLPGGLKPELMPKHVAIVMDGNRRWAKERGLPTEKGLHAGIDNLKYLILSACSKFRIKILTVYAFSTENWNSSQAEIDFLMSSFENFVKSYVMGLILRYDLRFFVLGDKSRLPLSLQSTISVAEESSKDNNGMQFVMAMSYSGHLDITEAIRKIAKKVEDGILRAEDIDEDALQQHLMTSLIQVPNPDLLIRTSGEMRGSNFLSWQLANAECYLTNKTFPDLEGSDLVEALASFQNRKTRYHGGQVDQATEI